MNGHPRDQAKVSVHCRWPLIRGNLTLKCVGRGIDNVAVQGRWPLTTGVAQGRYYCIDDLSISLSNVNAGCKFGGMSVNHFSYADDMAILSPSASGLQKLLNIGASYATEHDIIYNVKKTQCMVVPSTKFKLDIFIMFCRSYYLCFKATAPTFTVRICGTISRRCR